ISLICTHVLVETVADRGRGRASAPGGQARLLGGEAIRLIAAWRRWARLRDALRVFPPQLEGRCLEWNEESRAHRREGRCRASWRGRRRADAPSAGREAACFIGWRRRASSGPAARRPGA